MSRPYISATFVPTYQRNFRANRAQSSKDTEARRARSLAPRGRRPGAQRPTAIGHPPDMTKIVTDLLYFDSRARIFKLFFDLCRLFLVDPFLDRLGRRLDEILGFLETEAGDRADLLDYVDLLLADRGKDHIELGLLESRLDRRSRCSAAKCGHGDGCGGGDAPLFLQQLGQLCRLDHGQGREVIDQLCQIRHLLLLTSEIRMYH